MRMWMINPEYLCRNHLLGEHLECHMFASCLRLNKSLTGYLHKGLLEPQSLKARHDELVEEMIKRGYKHHSPLSVPPTDQIGLVCRKHSVKTLASRCDMCEVPF